MSGGPFAVFGKRAMKIGRGSCEGAAVVGAGRSFLKAGVVEGSTGCARIEPRIQMGMASVEARPGAESGALCRALALHRGAAESFQ